MRRFSLLRRHPFALLLLLGLVLRLGSAALMELAPVFPAFYFTDASVYDRQAQDLMRARRDSHAPWEKELGISPGRELYTAWLAVLYSALGHHPILPALANILFALVSIFVWSRLTRRLAGEGPALILTALLALWPTHCFYTAQNLKESMMLLVLPGAVYALAKALPAAGFAASGAAATAAACAACLLFVSGLIRSHMMPMLTATMAVLILLWAWGRRHESRVRLHAGTGLALLFAVLAGFPTLSNRLLKDFHRFDPQTQGSFLRGISPSEVSPPNDGPSSGERPRFLSPQWITQFRWLRQESDRVWARRFMGRDIRTQLFPGLRLDDWGDVAAFLPMGMFYVLFMPLPGLADATGHLGPFLASLENVLILLLFLLALSGLRRRWDRPLGIGLLVFFLSTWLSLAFFEFDLGSASRHRLIYVPFLLPFAALELDRILRRWSPAWKSLLSAS